jgi:hypothetical protein
MFEHRSNPLLSRQAFYRRLARCISLSFAVILAALGLGMIGYHVLENMKWVDAFVNSAMILSGMGPVGSLNTDAGKIFAGCYALFSGLAFATSIAIIFTPLFHRFIHKFHLEATERVARAKPAAPDTADHVVPRK